MTTNLFSDLRDRLWLASPREDRLGLELVSVLPGEGEIIAIRTVELPALFAPEVIGDMVRTFGLLAA